LRIKAGGGRSWGKERRYRRGKKGKRFEIREKKAGGFGAISRRVCYMLGINRGKEDPRRVKGTSKLRALKIRKLLRGDYQGVPHDKRERRMGGPRARAWQ